MFQDSGYYGLNADKAAGRIVHHHRALTHQSALLFAKFYFRFYYLSYYKEGGQTLQLLYTPISRKRRMRSSAGGWV